MRGAVVVGGGVAGLLAARDLAKAGVHVVLVEASGTLGGMIRRHTVAGIDVDMAAESFATRTDAVASLAIELGLGNELVDPDPRGAWLMTRDGRTAPMPSTGLLGIPGVPMAADVLAVVGQAGGLRAQMDSLLPSLVGSRAASLGELVRKRMGAKVLDDLVVPVVAGVHSTHPDDLDPDRVAPGLREALLRDGSLARAVVTLRERATAGSAVRGIRGGIVRIVDELIADLETYRVDVRLHTRALRIERAAVEVAGPDGDVERLVADHVVATVPDPERAASPSRTGIELVTLVVEQPELDAAPRGSGILVHPDATGVRAKALTHATAKWPWLAQAADGRHVLRLSYRADRADEADQGTSLPVDPRDETGARATADATALLGVHVGPEQVVGAARVRWSGPDTEPAGLAEGVIGTGEASTGRGLAGIVGTTRSAVRDLLAS
ncbi:FAD-dependent oxidoreductase [Curtobacterium sp. PhB136]|uniref:protoporphyrinogen/coproporphyrinogen oxidase n=1 Tax=Curtobacterium sp. PhB136 TaxID=2485181 RepID=UPI00104F4DA2|nr:FAD-dependent oxidoreductase [Curtobacterium sp. PhB136]TCK65919.1 oxygen-dependent protoporphyrinogen oxidase [Curtobacterium sp. PhB136]